MTQTAVTSGSGISTTWKTTTLDGIGQTASGPCACSPIGKMIKTSQPYTPGGSPPVNQLHDDMDHLTQVSIPRSGVT